MSLSTMFPPLYECSVCGKAVKVTQVLPNTEPTLRFDCPHVTATVYANRKVTLRGKGQVDAGIVKRSVWKITLTLRQLLSALTGRSV